LLRVPDLPLPCPHAPLHLTPPQLILRSYGTHIAYLILVFYLTPLKTYMAAIVSGAFIVLYAIIVLFNSLFRESFPGIPNCRSDGYMFRCITTNEEKTGKTISSLMEVANMMMVVVFVWVVCFYISYRHERTLRKNFMTVKTSRILTDIMDYNAIQNQKMLKSMLPESMIEKFKSKDSSVVVDT
jgi:hypothetical protein